jgi:hypothetical protein
MRRSASLTCTRCDKTGHNWTMCPIPTAPHVVEPYDGHEGMVRCADCRRASVPDYYGHGGCPLYVPSMRMVLVHCSRFKERTCQPS